MKKIIVILAALVSVAANAQTTQGQLFAGGNLGFSSTNFESAKDVKNTSFSIVPEIGYFVADNLAVGLGIGYGMGKVTRPTASVTTETTSSVFVISPFVTYFVATAGDKFFFTPQFRAGFNLGNQKIRETYGTFDQTVTAKTQNIDIAVSPGFTYFPSDNWALDFRIRGLYYNMNNPEGGNNNNSTVGLDVSSLRPTIGINYFF